MQNFTTLRFTGAKAQEFLQGQLTCDMRKLSIHAANSLTALCDHRGRMLANFWVVHWHNDFLFILPKSVSTLVSDHLKKYAVFSKVVITEEKKIIIVESENKSALQIENEVMTIPSLKRRIEDCLAILCDKTSYLFTPQMINLEKFGGVSFTKGCYVGQEIVARTQHLGTLKRHLHRLQIHSEPVLKAGDELKNKSGEPIGVIIDAIAITENQYDLLAVVQDSAATAL